MTRSRDAEHFQRMYDVNPDPWSFRTSAYERAKYQATIGALGDRRFRSGFEVGCSIGILTHMLADRCDTMLAIDFVEKPLTAAREICSDRPGVRFRCMTVPDEWPDETFDLIVLSEILYFLTPADIERLANRARTSLESGGLILMVNWLARSGDPCTGDEAAGCFLDASREWLQARLAHREDHYRLDLLEKR